MTTNLDNAGFAPALMDVLGRFHAEEITEAAAAAEVLALINRWYTYTGTLAETLTGYIGSIDGFIVTDGTPSDAVGVDGEYALDNTNGQLFGPKASGAWGASILTLGGEDGADGADGADGRTILFGTGAPGSGVGADGDGYIATDTTTFYGPKASGAWPAGVSLVGPQGDAVELQASATHIQWRYEGEASWTDLVALADLRGEDGTEIELQATATHIQWRLVGGTWADLIALSALKGADGEEVSLQVTATHIQWRLGTDAWADLIALSVLEGPQGPQGDGLEIDATGLFSARSTYDAEAAGFVFLATDGAAGAGAPSVLYIRQGASGWSDAIPFQGEKGETGDAISLDGFVPYATLITGSGALIPGALSVINASSEVVLALDVTTEELGDTYELSNIGTSDAQIDPGDSGGHIAIGSMSAGDRLTLEPGDQCVLSCTSLTGPTFKLIAAS